MSQRQSGFTLVEMLIVVAIIGLIAGIAVPRVMDIYYRSQQTRTMADMKAIGEALEKYAMQYGIYPAGLNGTVEQTIQPLLAPEFMDRCPEADAWGGALQWVSDSEGECYSIISYGKGGRPGSQAGGRTHLFTDDIVFSRRNFTQWPEGQQK